MSVCEMVKEYGFYLVLMFRRLEYESERCGLVNVIYILFIVYEHLLVLAFVIRICESEMGRLERCVICV